MSGSSCTSYDSDSTFARYGGEEFLLALPYAEDASARACIERLHNAINAAPFQTSAGALTITFSAGVAHYRKGETIAAMLNRADEALYRAKIAGRDRVEIADKPPTARAWSSAMPLFTGSPACMRYTGNGSNACGVSEHAGVIP